MVCNKKCKYSKAITLITLSSMLMFPNIVFGAPAVLKTGSKGTNVSNLQQELKNLGFYKYHKITGYYGLITKDAVSDFQKSKGLKIDGIAGPDTFLALKNANNKAKNNNTNVSNKPTENILPSRGNSRSVKFVRVLKTGLKGDDVKALQQILYEKGLYIGKIDGIFGPATGNAVRLFQKSKGLVTDGIVGKNTSAALNAVFEPSRGSVNRPVQKPSETNKPESKKGVEKPQKDKQEDKSKNKNTQPNESQNIKEDNTKNNIVQLIPWDQADKIFGRKSTAKITDIDTRKSFMVYRMGGIYHADVEPLTSNDTSIMKSIYGGSWSWSRRAITVEINGIRIAASMNGMPHGRQTITNNNFNGQFCIHFLGSITHNSKRLDKEHQAMVQKAAASK